MEYFEESRSCRAGGIVSHVNGHVKIDYVTQVKSPKTAAKCVICSKSRHIRHHAWTTNRRAVGLSSTCERYSLKFEEIKQLNLGIWLEELIERVKCVSSATAMSPVQKRGQRQSRFWGLWRGNGAVLFRKPQDSLERRSVTRRLNHGGSHEYHLDWDCHCPIRAGIWSA